MIDSPHVKNLGAYYTPPHVVRSLVRWGTKASLDSRVLDPSCGDGRFLQDLKNATGVDIDPGAARYADARSRGAVIINADFFSWAATTTDRFDAAIGNPPFIRYQAFRGALRTRALELCRANGLTLTALSSSWAPFIAGAASLLKQGGRMGFVVPAEIGHAVYARPMIQWLMKSFGRVEVIAIREKLFPELSEDCWLLRCADFGAYSDELHFARLMKFESDEALWRFESVPESHLQRWDYRLRPLLLPRSTRDDYQRLAALDSVQTLGSVAKLGIGYVTGANDFFHLSRSEVARMRIPVHVLRVTVRSNRDLADRPDISDEVVSSWLEEDRPVYLLDLARVDRLPKPVQNYLDSTAATEARKAYKCRNRTPWYAVPDVATPDAFLSIMSARDVKFVTNSAGATCTNSIQSVSFYKPGAALFHIKNWQHPLTRLSCEVEGHALGGGLLKMEPQEARKLLLAGRLKLSPSEISSINEGIEELRRWRNGKQK
jgi:adenine-specific DNA methylase